jgi:hypothetical protein
MVPGHLLLILVLKKIQEGMMTGDNMTLLNDGKLLELN